MNKNTIIIILAAIFILGIGGGAYFYFQSNLQIGQPEAQPTIIPSPQITFTPTPSQTQTKTVPDDWEIYTSQDHNFQIGHPPEMETSINPDEGVRFLLSGPSQSQGTEVTDGILLIINSGAYQQQSFQEFVQSQADEQEQNPATESASEIQSVSVGGINGYSFDTVSLGESTYYYLDKGNNQYLRIIKIVQDPSEQQFKQTVDQMFSSLTLI